MPKVSACGGCAWESHVFWTCMSLQPCSPPTCAHSAATSLCLRLLHHQQRVGVVLWARNGAG